MCFVLASSAKAWLFGSASELLIFPSVCCVQDVRGVGGGHLTGPVACLGDSGTLLAGTERSPLVPSFQN